MTVEFCPAKLERNDVKRAYSPVIPILLGLAAFSPLHPADAAESIGTVAAVNRDMDGTPPQSQRRSLELGARVVRNERIETSEIGSGQLLFMDQTSLAVAPDSDIVLDTYTYDPDQQSGDMALTLTRGTLRFIGGRISKKRDVTVRTPTATIGIRGGLCIIAVSPGGDTTVVQIAGEYTSVTGSGGRKVILSRPSSAASAKPDGSVSFEGLLTQEELNQFHKALEGSGEGGSNTADQEQQTDTQVRRISTLNSEASDGEDRQPVSTSGEKKVAGGGDGGTEPPPQPPEDGTTSDPQPTGPTPTDGAFFSPSTGFGGFNAISRGSLIGTTPGGETVRIPVAESNTDFVTSIAGSPVPTYFAQSLSPNAGFFEFVATAGGTSSSLGPISGFGFSDLDTNFHLYQFDTTPSGGPVEHGYILFGNPSPTQGAVFEGDDGSSIPSTANTVGVYRIEPDLNPVGGPGGPPEAVLVISNGGEARFAHGSTSLPASPGARTLVAEATFNIGPGGIQESSFSAMVAPIRGGGSGGPRIGATIFHTSVSGIDRFIDNSNVGTFEDANGNTVFGPDDRYIVMSSLHRPGGTGSFTFDPGTFHGLGQNDQPLEPFVSLLTRDAGADFIVSDPLLLANDTPSRTGVGFGRSGAMDVVFANGMAACSTGNCGALLSSAGFSGVYPLISLTAELGDGGHFEFQSGTSPSGPDTNSLGANFKVFDFVDLGNIQRSGGTSEVPYEFGFTSAINDVSAYVDDAHFALSTNAAQSVDGQSVSSQFLLASEGLATDGGIIPGTAGPTPEFLRWGWWSAAFDVTENGGSTREDLVHMGTWVAGLRPNQSDIPTGGIASFSGLAVGTDADLATGTTAVVGGDFSMTYDFGQAQGAFNLNIAGHGFSNVGVFGNTDNPEFAAFAGFESRSGATLVVDGAFFSGGGDPIAATGGQFQIDDFAGDRQVVGIFAGDKTSGGGGP